MNKHKSNKIKENSNTVRHLIMGQIITTQNLVAIKEVRHAGQSNHKCTAVSSRTGPVAWCDHESSTGVKFLRALHSAIFTVGHRRQVTAVTRLPRWRRQKTRLQVRPLLTMLQDMDRCDFLHANRYWIGLTCDAVMFDPHASERRSGALVFSGGRRVT